MTTNLVHNGGQRTTGTYVYPTLTWQAAGSWTNSYGEFRSYANSTDRNAWETNKLDIVHNSTTYYIAFKPYDTAHDANDWPKLTNHSGTVHLQNGTTVDWWDRFISFSNIGTVLSNSNNGTYSSTDQYGRLPSTAVTKTFRKSRAAYRIDYPQDHVLEVDESTVNGGYDTFNVPSEIYCLRLRDTHYEVQADYNLFLANKLPLTRNGKTYLDFMFGMTIPDVLDSTYRYISLQASAPYQIASGKWYVNYTTHGWNTSTLMYDELITGYSHNPAHSVLVIYNITDNIWQSQLGQITSYDWTDPPPEYIDPGDVVTTYSNITVSCVSPNDTEQWNGFSNLSFTTTNLFRFNVEKETNVYSNDLPPQNEVEVATTTSNGGGKPDRYPLIMTNLFNRNRSIYSIGMTHKDKWDLFL